MRIVLDLQGAQTASRFRGIGRYSLALAEAVARNASGHDVWIAANGNLTDGLDALRARFASLVPATRFVTFATPGDTSWEHAGHRWRRAAAELAREAFLRDLAPDAIHVTSLFEGTTDAAVTSVGLLPAGGCTGVTLYDLIPLHDPQAYLGEGWVRDWYMSKVDSLQRAGLLLSISAHARQEAIDALGIAPAKIVNMSSAASPDFHPVELTAADWRALKQGHGINGPYVMYSGAMDKRKNVEALIEAFARLPAELTGGLQLVIAGKIHADDQQRLQAAADRYGMSSRTVFTGYVSDEDLVTLYNGARLYVFPSLHEGFGLPALEAMACGVATIGSNTTSVPEVIGRGDAMFDPSSVEAIASLMHRALADNDFHQSLRDHARSHAAEFSWDATAKRLLHAYEEASDGRAARDRSWAVVSQAISQSYDELIEAVANVPRDDVELATDDTVRAAAMIAENQEEALHAARTASSLPASLSWRVEGPFDSSYSLALVNRELARAFGDRGVHVALHSTEGPGDFDPSPEFLRSRPDLAAMHGLVPVVPAESADVSSRLLYPPRVLDMTSRFNLLHCYAWEESGFPPEWVDNFNLSLQGVSLLSRHVGKIMIDNGVAVPMSMDSGGVDHWARIEIDPTYIAPGKAFRFLHVSSCFPRKGVDVLLNAYGDAFTSADDVTLVIKTFANPHNEVHDWLADAKRSRTDFPDVVIIEADIPDARLKALYQQCHALVAPSRAEGFGLPMAEAMASGLPVIATGWGGHTDFCTPDTAWLVDFKFSEAKTHFGLAHSVWAEPDREDLASVLRHVYGLDPVVRAEKARRGQARVAEMTWDRTAASMEGFVRRMASAPRARAPRIAWISTWNKRCGIASYSGHLVDHMPAADITIMATFAHELTAPDRANVVRCWDSERPDLLTGLCAVLAKEASDVVVIQFQYGFFEFEPLARLIEEQKDAGRVVIVMLHATQDPAHVPTRRMAMLVAAFARCDRLLVHGVADLNRLKELGLVENVAIIPHGIPSVDHLEPFDKPSRFRLASYGFCLPHKGLPQLVDAVSLLVGEGREVELLMLNAEYPVGESTELLRALETQVAELGLKDRVRIISEYLPDEGSFRHLLSADLILFPYQGTGESSSAAVRYGLAVGRPVAVTPISIFDDVGGAVHRLPGVDPAALARGIAAIMDGAVDMPAVEQTAERWRGAHRYTALGRRLYNILFSLHTNGQSGGA